MLFYHYYIIKGSFKKSQIVFHNVISMLNFLMLFV